MPTLSQTRLTTSLCRSLGTGDHPDAEVRGLSLRVTKAGARSFTVRYRSADGRQRRITLGQLGEISLSEARKKATDLKSGVNHGADPSADRAQLRSEPTIADLAAKYLEAKKLKPKTIQSYRSVLKVHILPVFGDCQASQVTAAQLRDFYMERSKEAKIQAGAAIKFLRSLFNWANKLELVKCENPAKKVEIASSKNRRRYLNRDERQRFWAALDSIESDSNFHGPLIQALRVLAWTGARRREITGLKWCEIDFDESLIVKVEHKTDEHDAVRTVYLSEDALSIITKIKETRGDSPYVFPAAMDASKPVDHVIGLWRRMLEISGLENFRVHDLRHSFASDALSQGASLPLIGAVLGHSSPKTTARYAHLCSDTARMLVASTADRMRPDQS